MMKTLQFFQDVRHSCLKNPRQNDGNQKRGGPKQNAEMRVNLKPTWIKIRSKTLNISTKNSQAIVIPKCGNTNCTRTAAVHKLIGVYFKFGMTTSTHCQSCSVLSECSRICTSRFSPTRELGLVSVFELISLNQMLKAPVSLCVCVHVSVPGKVCVLMCPGCARVCV